MQKFENPDTLNSVAAFHHTFEHCVLTTPAFPDEKTQAMRYNLIAEELQELKQAISDNDIVAVADALADLQYVLTGTVLSFGLGSVFKKLFDEVQRSNMSKACETEEEAQQTIEAYPELAYFIKRAGKFLVRRTSDDKTIKSVNYSPANLALIVFEASLKPGQVWLEYIEGKLHQSICVVSVFQSQIGEGFNMSVIDESGWIRNFTKEYLHQHCELVENIERMADSEEKARVIALQREYEKYLKREQDKPAAQTVGEEMLNTQRNSAHGYTEGSEPENLIGALQKELQRNRELLEEYKKIGSAGAFGAAMITKDIETAERAITNHDTVQMVVSLKALRETK